jgi:hypothetical protein
MVVIFFFALDIVEFAVFDKNPGGVAEQLLKGFNP